VFDVLVGNVQHVFVQTSSLTDPTQSVDKQFDRVLYSQHQGLKGAVYDHLLRFTLTHLVFLKVLNFHLFFPMSGALFLTQIEDTVI